MIKEPMEIRDMSDVEQARERIAEELWNVSIMRYGWDDVDNGPQRDSYLRMADWVIYYGLRIENRELQKGIDRMDRCLKTKS